MFLSMELFFPENVSPQETFLPRERPSLRDFSPQETIPPMEEKSSRSRFPPWLLFPRALWDISFTGFFAWGADDFPVLMGASRIISPGAGDFLALREPPGGFSLAGFFPWEQTTSWHLGRLL